MLDHLRTGCIETVEPSLPLDLLQAVAEFCDTRSLARLLQAGNYDLHCIISHRLWRQLQGVSRSRNAVATTSGTGSCLQRPWEPYGVQDMSNNAPKRWVY